MPSTTTCAVAHVPFDCEAGTSATLRLYVPVPAPTVFTRIQYVAPAAVAVMARPVRMPPLSHHWVLQDAVMSVKHDAPVKMSTPQLKVADPGAHVDAISLFPVPVAT